MTPEARAALVERLTGSGCEVARGSLSRGSVVAAIAFDGVSEFMTRMRDDEGLAFDLLIDLTAIDLRAGQSAFGLVYQLYSSGHDHRLAVKVSLAPDQPSIASLVPIWPGANWLEREVYDLFGIEFAGHPDLRRILLPADFEGHPLRRDFEPRSADPSNASDARKQSEA